MEFMNEIMSKLNRQGNSLNRTVIPTKVGTRFLKRSSLDPRLLGNVKKTESATGQSVTEFIIVFPVLLLMLCSVIFFARMLVLKQRSVTAVRYVAWYAGRNGGNEPSQDTIKALFFNKSSEIAITHPAPSIGFSGNSLGDLGSVLGSVAGINGTALRVKGDYYPFSQQKSSTGTQHFVFMDTWKDSGITGKALKYGLWAIAVAKGFQNGSGSGNGGNASIDLENPSIFGN